MKAFHVSSLRPSGGHVALWVTLVLSAIGVLVGILVWRIFAASEVGQTIREAITDFVSPEDRAAREKINQTVGQHSQWARNELQSRIEAYVAEVEQFFAGAKGRIPDFASQACDSWQYMTSTEDAFRQFVHQKFREIVLSEESLQELLKDIHARFVADVRNLDNEMLVRIQADLADEPLLQRCTFSIPSVDNEIASLSQVVVSQMPEILTQRIGGFVVSFVAGEVVSLLITRLTTAAAVRTASVASGWFTFGVGLVVGMVIDAYISESIESEIRDQVYRELAPRLDAICHQVINGDNRFPGLRRQLVAAASEYFQRREKALVDHLVREARQQLAAASSVLEP